MSWRLRNELLVGKLLLGRVARLLERLESLRKTVMQGLDSLLRQVQDKIEIRRVVHCLAMRRRAAFDLHRDLREPGDGFALLPDDHRGIIVVGMDDALEFNLGTDAECRSEVAYGRDHVLKNGDLAFGLFVGKSGVRLRVPG